MHFSLVVATIGRTAELRRLLTSLEEQTHSDFDVIIVDQNADGRLVPVIDEFSVRLDLRRLASPAGASRARNVGIREVTGEIVGFPDDDCWYPCDALQILDRLMTEHPEWDALIGEAVDPSGKPLLPWRDRSGRVTMPLCWRRSVTFAYFLRARLLKKLGEFDEALGPGAGVPWGSGEDIDMMLRAVERGYPVQYGKRLQIHHPRIFLSFDEGDRAKRYRYSLGEGRLLRKHPMPLWWMALFLSMPFGRMTLAMLRFANDEIRFHWATGLGRIRGLVRGAS